MQVNDLVVILFPEFRDYFINFILNRVKLINVRICFQDGQVMLFGKKMDFNSRKLLFQAAHNRCGKNDISNGTEPDDKDLFQT